MNVNECVRLRSMIVLTPMQIELYTRVLKGHVDLASTVFPAGTSGLALDSLARRHLWSVGLDYPHGVCLFGTVHVCQFIAL